MIKTLTPILAAMLFSPAASTLCSAPTPHGLGVEDTYTITSILKVLKPCNPSVMTDPYQDVKVLSSDGTSITLSITYFPLNDKVRAMRIRTYATKPGDLKSYLRPTVTCNWDLEMRAELVRDLKIDGIDPAKLKPAELVSKVAPWAFERSRFASNSDAMPSDWFIDFAGNAPRVYPPTRKSFEDSKPDPHWTDQQVFDHQLFGRQMFEARYHGACTSSSIYLATILRALGVPTKILYFIPPCDANDSAQLKALSDAISRRVTRQTIMDGATLATGFANHMFNEVWLDGRWQRLNYSTLGQEIVDKDYLGLMTHIDTCADISETHLANTWGLRAERWPNVPVKLTSVNPYELIAATDHWGKNAAHDDPAPADLSRATVISVLWPDSAEYRELIPDGNGFPKTDFLLQTKEWDPNRNYVQMREFVGQANPHFVLRAVGHPDVPFYYNGLNCSNYHMRGYAMRFNDPAAKLAPGVTYSLVPSNQHAAHLWKVAPGLTVTGR